MLALVSLLVVAMTPARATAVSKCLHYDPDVVSLTGSVIFRTFADAAGRPERVPLLLLDDPICVEAPKDDRADIFVDEGDELIVHLNVDDDTSEGKLAGRRVLASGTLYHRHTSHHHAALVLKVRELKVVRQ